MKNTFRFMVVGILLSGMALISQVSFAELKASPQDLANEYGEMGLEALKAGNAKQASHFLRMATRANPYESKWHVHYGRILSKQGEALAAAGRPEEAKAVFKMAEKEMLMAGNIFAGKGDKVSASNLYFQVAQLNEFAFKRKITAQLYYKRALELNPEHEGAKKALA